MTPTNLPTTATLITLGSLALGYTDSIGLAMAGIAIDDQRDIGTAVGLAGCIRNTISTVGTAIYSVRGARICAPPNMSPPGRVMHSQIRQAIQTNRLAQTIPRQVPPALVSAGLPASSVPDFLAAYATGTEEAFAAVAGLNATILEAGTRAYKNASADAYRTVFLSTIAFSVVAVVFALFTADGSKKMTHDVAATLHERSSTKVVGKGEDAETA